MNMCASVCSFKLLSVQGRDQTQSSSGGILIFETGTLIFLELIDQSRLSTHQASRAYQLMTTQHLHYKSPPLCLVSFHGIWRSHIDPTSKEGILLSYVLSPVYNFITMYLVMNKSYFNDMTFLMHCKWRNSKEDFLKKILLNFYTLNDHQVFK